jgi:hypothetical protein
MKFFTVYRNASDVEKVVGCLKRAGISILIRAESPENGSFSIFVENTQYNQAWAAFYKNCNRLSLEEWNDRAETWLPYPVLAESHFSKIKDLYDIGIMTREETMRILSVLMFDIDDLLAYNAYANENSSAFLVARKKAEIVFDHLVVYE